MQTLHLTTALNQTLEKGLIFQSASDHIVYKLSEEGFGHQIAVKWKAVQNFFSNPFQIFTKIDMMLQWIAIAYLFLQKPNFVRSFGGTSDLSSKDSKFFSG
jgi:hypothetical protein